MDYGSGVKFIQRNAEAFYLFNIQYSLNLKAGMEIVTGSANFTQGNIFCLRIYVHNILLE
jgi:hypothetical protein